MTEQSDALAVPIDVTMRRPTLFAVPAMPILPTPLVVRRAQVEEAGALAALLGRAFEAESWDAAGTERELFCDETVRATLVVAADGRLVVASRRRLANSAPHPTSRRRHDLRVEHDIVNPGAEEFAFVEVELK